MRRTPEYLIQIPGGIRLFKLNTRYEIILIEYVRNLTVQELMVLGCGGVGGLPWPVNEPRSKMPKNVHPLSGCAFDLKA